MADNLAAAIARASAEASSTVLRTGQVVRGDGSALAVSVGGIVLPATWADPVVVREGDPVLVALISAGVGQSEVIVLCRLTASYRPGEGAVTAAPSSSPTISVRGTDGVVYTAKFVGSYTPVVGDTVTLSWQASVPYVIGKVGTTAAPTPPPAPAPPPGSSKAGTGRYAAIDSATWNASRGNWSSLAGVRQGAWQGTTYTGAWFYGTSPGELAGATITGFRFRMPGRMRVGDYNDAAPVHLYVHTSATRPGGEPGRSAGPVDFVVPPGYGGGDLVPLPPALAPQVVAGGGIAIAGGPYVGLNDRGADPESGRIELDWAR